MTSGLLVAGKAMVGLGGCEGLKKWRPRENQNEDFKMAGWIWGVQCRRDAWRLPVRGMEASMTRGELVALCLCQRAGLQVKVLGYGAAN